MHPTLQICWDLLYVGDWNCDTWMCILVCSMTLKRTGNAAVIGKLNMAAIQAKWRYNNFLSDNRQGKRHLSIMENCMSNNVVAILNSNMAAI